MERVGGFQHSWARRHVAGRDDADTRHQRGHVWARRCASSAPLTLLSIRNLDRSSAGSPARANEGRIVNAASMPSSASRLPSCRRSRRPDGRSGRRTREPDARSSAGCPRSSRRSPPAGARATRAREPGAGWYARRSRRGPIGSTRWLRQPSSAPGDRHRRPALSRCTRPTSCRSRTPSTARRRPLRRGLPRRRTRELAGGGSDRCRRTPPQTAGGRPGSASIRATLRYPSSKVMRTGARRQRCPPGGSLTPIVKRDGIAAFAHDAAVSVERRGADVKVLECHRARGQARPRVARDIRGRRHPAASSAQASAGTGPP